MCIRDRYWPPNELVLPCGGSYVCANFGENRSRNATVRVPTDGQIHTMTDANRFYNAIAMRQIINMRTDRWCACLLKNSVFYIIFLYGITCCRRPWNSLPLDLKTATCSTEVHSAHSEGTLLADCSTPVTAGNTRDMRNSTRKPRPVSSAKPYY